MHLNSLSFHLQGRQKTLKRKKDNFSLDYEESSDTQSDEVEMHSVQNRGKCNVNSSTSDLNIQLVTEKENESPNAMNIIGKRSNVKVNQTIGRDDYF